MVMPLNRIKETSPGEGGGGTVDRKTDSDGDVALMRIQGHLLLMVSHCSDKYALL